MSLEQDNKCGASSLLHCTKNGMKNGTGCSKKLNINADFFCLGCIHNVNMNQSFFFHYLRQGTASLEYYYFVLHGHKKRRCF